MYIFTDPEAKLLGVGGGAGVHKAHPHAYCAAHKIDSLLLLPSSLHSSFLCLAPSRLDVKHSLAGSLLSVPTEIQPLY